MSDLFFDESSIPQGYKSKTDVESGKAMGVLGFMKVAVDNSNNPLPDGNWFKLKFKKFLNKDEVSIVKKDLDDQVPVDLKANIMTTFIASEMVIAMNSPDDNIMFEPKYLGGKKRRSKTSSKRSKNRRSKKSRK